MLVKNGDSFLFLPQADCFGNPRARGEHLTSQFSWAATWLLLIRVFPLYQAEELVLFVFHVPL